MTLPIVNPCIPCTLTRPACCNVLNGTAHPVLLTEEEVEHAARCVGKTFDDVATWRSRTEAEVFTMMRRHDDRKRVPSLRVRADGSCYFLGERGCVLFHSDKPSACRMFPLAYNGHDWYITPPWRGCYAIEQGKNAEGVMCQFGMTAAALGELI